MPSNNQKSAKSPLKSIIFSIFLLIASIFLGLIFEVFAYMIPTDRIRENIARGVDIYHSETNFYMFSDGYLSTMNDNDSDSVILSITAYSTGNPLKDALSSEYPSVISGEENAPRILNILSYSHFHPDQYQFLSYSRYWHGYVTVLKPFFYFFDFADARVFNYICQLCLYMYVGYLLIKNNKSQYSLAYFVLLAIFNPVIIALAFQYSPCTYIMLIAMCILLKYQTFLEEKHMIPCFFMILGIITSYFDFLTFPFVTLGIPTVILILNNDATVVKFKKCFLCGFLWCFGYVGMWSGKWLLGSLFLDQNLLEEAIYYIKHRTGHINPEITRLGALINVCSVLAKWPYLLLSVAVFIFLFIKYIVPVIKAKEFKYFLQKILPFIFVGLYGIIWILFTYEHCDENLKFTYRELGITAFSFVSGIIYAGNEALTRNI